MKKREGLDLIVDDISEDPQSEPTIMTPEQAQKVREWFDKVKHLFQELGSTVTHHYSL